MQVIYLPDPVKKICPFLKTLKYKRESSISAKKR